MRLVALLTLSCLVSFPVYAGPEEAIVGLYVTLGGGRSDLGTGFFSSENGQIVTAYHVVLGARKIKAVDFTGQMYDDLRVSYVSPKFDLAVLQIVSKPKTSGYLTFTREIPTPNDELMLIGYPRGLPTQYLRARSTSYKLLSSFTLRNERGQRLFNQDIQILPLDAKIYSGMSGAPVISGGKVHGVLSGSFDEGGTIGWMIPAMHLDTLIEFGQTPEKVETWPAFDLMASAFKTLTRSFQIDSTGEGLLEAYLEAVERFSEAGERIASRAAELQAQAVVTRPFFEMFLNDTSLSKDRDVAFSYLEYPFNQFLKAIEPYGQAHTDFGKATQELGNRAYELLEWADELARENAAIREYLVAADQRIQRRQSAGNYYEAIGYDPQRIAETTARFAGVVAKLDGSYSETGMRQFVSAMLSIGKEFEADAAIHASASAIMVMRRTTMDFRSIAREFEPLVYR